MPVNRPNFTVFTPTFNRAYILPKLFKSLQKQGSLDFEWLIVDDGSSDDTQNLIASFQQEALFPVRYIHQKNQGKHVAINTGVANAKGAFFMTVDSDDQVMENALANLFSYFSTISNNSNIVAIASMISIKIKKIRMI